MRRTSDRDGFGLSIVDGPVRAYGGRAWVGADKPSGLAFWVELCRA
ncbi:hypothetical protein [Haloplanus sp.]|nr:hypothetical protein [Haloplanus sp.]